VRQDGRIVAVPLAYKARRVDFGDGEKLAMTIPWGDVSTAYATTGIPNIEVYIPGTPAMVARGATRQPAQMAARHGHGSELHEAAHRKDGQRVLGGQTRCAAHIRLGRGYKCARRQTHRSDQDGQQLQPYSDRCASSREHLLAHEYQGVPTRLPSCSAPISSHACPAHVACAAARRERPLPRRLRRTPKPTSRPPLASRQI
jgi:hypothetical protein